MIAETFTHVNRAMIAPIGPYTTLYIGNVLTYQMNPHFAPSKLREPISAPNQTSLKDTLVLGRNRYIIVKKMNDAPVEINPVDNPPKNPNNNMEINKNVKYFIQKTC